MSIAQQFYDNQVISIIHSTLVKPSYTFYHAIILIIIITKGSNCDLLTSAVVLVQVVFNKIHSLTSAPLALMVGGAGSM